MKHPTPSIGANPTRPVGSVCLTLLVFLSCLPAVAQEGRVEGVVRDRNGEGLPGVNVVVRGTGIGAATDVDGTFRIPQIPAGHVLLIASAVGYVTETLEIVIEANGVTRADFTLRENVLEYDAVVVTASRREQAASAVPMTVSLVTPREIETRNHLDLSEVLRRIPGVQLAGSSINVRGSSGFSYGVGSRVLLLVDGSPMLGPDDGSVPSNLLPLSRIERVEVVKGPGSALYGGSALGGVINVITKDPPSEPETDIRLYGGAYEPTRYAAWRASWSEGSDVQPFAGGTITHAQRVGSRAAFWANVAYQGDAGYQDLSRFSNLFAHGKIGVRLRPGLRLDMMGGLTRRDRELFIFWADARNALRPAATDFLSGGQRATVVNHGSFLPVMTHVISPRLYQTVRGRLFTIRVQPRELDGSFRSRDKWTVANRYGAEWQMVWNPTPNRYVTTGVSGDWNNGRSDFYSGTEQPRRRLQPEAAAFVQMETQTAFDVTLVAGARLDLYVLDLDETITRLSPKLNASWAPSPAFVMRASFGQGFRVPSVAERYVDNRDFFPIVSNVTLLPERSTGYEFGIKSLLPVGALGFVHVDVAGFWNEYEDLVDPKFRPERNAFQFINLTRARIRGIDSEVRLSLLDDRISVQAGYLLLDPQDLTGSRIQPLAYRSDHLIQIGSSLRPFGPFDVGIDYRYASRPERMDSDFTRFVPDSDLMVAQHVVDLRLGYTLTRVRFGLLAKNALEYYYVERPALLAPPRHYVGQLQVTL